MKKKIILILLALVVILYFLPAGEFRKIRNDSNLPLGGGSETCIGLSFNNACSPFSDGGGVIDGVYNCKGQCYGLIFQQPYIVNPIVEKIYYLSGRGNPNRF